MLNDKFKLYITNPSGDIIQEPETQFILSLAPKEPAKIESIDELMFSDDKIGYEYYYGRQLQLDQSIARSKKTGQYAIYEETYLPVKNLFHNEALEIDMEKRHRIFTQIDIHLKPLNGLHPLNPSDLPNIPPEISETILSLHDIDCHIAPEGTKINSIPIPPWKPNMDSVKSDAFSLGYFTGPSNQHFYTPQCGNGIFTHATPDMAAEAKGQMQAASKSILLPYAEVLKLNITPFKITNRRIYYLENCI